MKKFILAMIAAFMALSLYGCVDEKSDSVRYYYPDNMTRILREQKLEGDGQIQTLSMGLAHNEYEGMQFIINSDADLTDVKVTVGELKNEDGQTVPAEDISVYRQHYIFYGKIAAAAATRLGVEPSYEGWYPNALIPMFDGSDGGFKNDEFDVEAGMNQGYWITVRADADLPAGTYTGDITVSYGDKKDIVPMQVEVWDFEIPEKSTLETFYGYWPDVTYEWYDHFYPDLDIDMGEIQKTYMDFLRTFRIDVGPDSFEYETDEEYIAGLKAQIEAGITKHYGLPFKYEKEDTVEKLVERNKDYYQKFEDAGILKYGYIYTVDEPHTEEQFEQVNKTAAAVRAMGFPTLRLLVTHGYKEGVLEDVSYWCPTAPYMSKEFIATQRAKGNDSAWYGYLPVSLTKTNDLHYTFWMSRYYDVAHLSWCTNMFKKFATEGAESEGEYVFRDVWSDAVSFTDTVESGYYIFPGAEGDGVVGRNIPVGTIQLHAIRDGLEEYEYFTILQNRYSEWLEAWDADITLDEVMYTYYYPSFTGFGNQYASTDTSRTVAIRKHAAEDILNDEQAIVAVLPSVNDGYEYSREVTVYTPQEAEVIVDGHTLSPEKLDGCYKYTYVADASQTRVIEISVNGSIYHRYIVPEKDEEYGQLVKNIVYSDADEFGLDMEEKFDIGSYMWDVYMTDELTFEEDEAVRALKLASIENLQHSKIPVVLMVTDVDGTAFTEKDFKVYAPKASQISINGVEAQLSEEHESYDVYTARIDVGTTPYSISTITVVNGDQTEEQEFLIHQGTGALSTLVDFDESGDAISSIASNGIEEGYSVLSDGAMVSSFGPQSLISLMFDSSCLRTTDISGYTHIRLTVRNMTDVEAPGLSLTVYAEGFDAELGSTGTIPAGETAVIDLQLPEAAADKFAALKMLYLLSDADTLDESTYTYRIEDIYAVSKQ